MVDRRPQMQRSRWNASVLILTCSIRRTEKSWMTHLFLAVEWTRFSPLRGIVSSQPLPIVFLLCATSSFLFLLLQTQGRLHHCNANQDGALGAAWPRFNSFSLKAKGVPASAHPPCLLFSLDFSSSCQQGEKKGDEIKQRKVDFQVMGELICPCFFPWSLPGD
jgi:hypothetical protein